jgi:hypothetical protein
MNELTRDDELKAVDVASALLINNCVLSIVCSGRYWHASIGTIHGSKPPVNVSDMSLSKVIAMVYDYCKGLPR